MRARLLAGLVLAALLTTGLSARAADVVVLTPTFPPPAPAKVTISLPEDAILLFNGVVAKGDGKTRAYLTPPLPAGQPFMYELTAVVVRGHQLIVVTERVVVWSGEESKVMFPLPAVVIIPSPRKQ